MKSIRKGLGIVRPEQVESMYEKCPSCSTVFSKKEMSESGRVCPSCGYHLKIGALERIRLISDPNSFIEAAAGMTSYNILNFPDYRQVLKEAKQASGLNEAYVFGSCTINSMPAVVGVLDSSFVMGSMGVVVGEKIAMSVELAQKERLPLIIFSASGGARMQEGTVSLMQMAKTTSAIEQFSEKGGLFISFLTNPTTGGVTASFATLGDITLAEPGALIGFAGPRVIEQTISRKLPKGFQRSEYLENHGFVDRIVERSEMRDVLTDILKLHADTRQFSAVKRSVALENK
jgi:acetyl-CoA carboxylase carboxyl transferase subunit beta